MQVLGRMLRHTFILLAVGDVAHEHRVNGHVKDFHEHRSRQPRDNHHQRGRRDRVVHLQGVIVLDEQVVADPTDHDHHHLQMQQVYHRIEEGERLARREEKW